jgi:hypothetical protein
MLEGLMDENITSLEVILLEKDKEFATNGSFC